jgi:hypothetical protein
LVARAGFAPAFRGYEPLVLSYATTATTSENWSGWQELNLRGHVPKTCGWPLPYTRIWLSKIREGLAALSCVALHADHLTQRVYYIHQITIIRRWLQYYGRYYRSPLYPTMRDLDRDLGPLGQAQIQKAATPSPPGDALDRTHFAPRSEAVRSLADGGAAWLHDGSCMSREAHVQFCERLGVQLPEATHLVVGFQHRTKAERF